METSIHHDPRRKSDKGMHRVPSGINCNNARSQAFRDITADIAAHNRENRTQEYPYIQQEAATLRLIRFVNETKEL